MKNNCGRLPKNQILSLVSSCGSSVEEIEKRFGPELLPLKYRPKPDTVILIDIEGRPMVKDNGDGTWSGLDIKVLYNGKAR